MWGEGLQKPEAAGARGVFCFGVVSALFLYPKVARREVDAHLKVQVIKLT